MYSWINKFIYWTGLTSVFFVSLTVLWAMVSAITNKKKKKYPGSIERTLWLKDKINKQIYIQVPDINQWVRLHWEGSIWEYNPKF